MPSIIAICFLFVAAASAAPVAPDRNPPPTINRNPTRPPPGHPLALWLEEGDRLRNGPASVTLSRYDPNRPMDANMLAGLGGPTNGRHSSLAVSRPARNPPPGQFRPARDPPPRSASVAPPPYSAGDRDAAPPPYSSAARQQNGFPGVPPNRNQRDPYQREPYQGSPYQRGSSRQN